MPAGDLSVNTNREPFQGANSFSRGSKCWSDLDAEAARGLKNAENPDPRDEFGCKPRTSVGAADGARQDYELVCAGCEGDAQRGRVDLFELECGDGRRDTDRSLGAGKALRMDRGGRVPQENRFEIEGNGDVCRLGVVQSGSGESERFDDEYQANSGGCCTYFSVLKFVLLHHRDDACTPVVSFCNLKMSREAIVKTLSQCSRLDVRCMNFEKGPHTRLRSVT